MEYGTPVENRFAAIPGMRALRGLTVNDDIAHSQ
ncbi:MAG: hypothetical protein QOC89_2128 [Paraburkholderia sp.]|jgi:hypothetical protein|nr:hypothetical protein [Paraburkholderia sp.]